MPDKTTRMSFSRWLLIPLFTLLLAAAPVLACAPFFPEDHFGYLAEEVALIIWNQETKQQHFIRRAGFRTQAQKVGFMVPTPSQPEFGEVDNDIFGRLDDLTRPEVIYKTRRYWKFRSIFSFFVLGGAGPLAGSAPRGVELLDHLTVADQEVAVLKASDVAALEKWLTDNDFPFDPAAREWLAPYIEEGYVISAFRYLAPEEGTEGVGSRAVRMTFTSEQPYFPYREPERPQDKSPGQRSLRVYLLTAKRMQGTLGETNWGAKMPYSAPVEIPDPLKELKPGNWLSLFDDTSVTRPSEHDLRFVPSPDQSEVKPPPRVVYEPQEIPIFLEVVLLIGAILFFKLRKAGKE